MRAFITGIQGQDGTYLAEYLSYAGYEVFGLVRSAVSPNKNWEKLSKINKSNWPLPTLYTGDVVDGESMRKIIADIKPDEIYHLAGQSHVGHSFHAPLTTINVNSLGTLSILEAVASASPNSKVYYAGTSEMFGNSIDADGFQRETTPMHPVSPYAASKLLGHNLIEQYRHGKGLFACSGILFNHESPLRGDNFVTTKVVKHAIDIVRGTRDKVYLGNITSRRDWGHAIDYVDAMIRILNQPKPDTYVVASGKTHSVLDLVSYVFTKLDLDIRTHLVANTGDKRELDIDELKGDSRKIRALGWSPVYTFEMTIDDMLNYYLNND